MRTCEAGKLKTGCSRRASPPREHGVSAPCRDPQFRATKKGKGARIASGSVNQSHLRDSAKTARQLGKFTQICVCRRSHTTKLRANRGEWPARPAVNLRGRLFSERTFGGEQDGAGQCGQGKRICLASLEHLGSPASPTCKMAGLPQPAVT